ncbi:MAG: hypothetical protein O3C27_00275 [Actinomycetota bacterium]|nr:hypothetical protein [Actinomycetota bacterium]
MTTAVANRSDESVSIGGEVLRRLWVLVVAGIPTGVIVAGLGSRLAMLALRLTSPDAVRGVTSDDGFEIGRFTLGGSYNLLLLGAFVGVIGAAAYLSVAPWLLGPGWFRRCTVGAAAGAVVGSMLVHDSGIDFHVLKPLWLAVGLFVALPALFGLAIGLAVDRLERRGPPRGHLRWIVPAALLAAFPPVIPIVLLAAVALAVWVPVRRLFVGMGDLPLVGAVAIRAGWLAIAVLGLVALVRDIRALT